MWNSRLEENRVDPELCVQKRHVAVDFDKEVETFVALVEMSIVTRQSLWTPGAAESPARCHLSSTAKE